MGRPLSGREFVDDAANYVVFLRAVTAALLVGDTAEIGDCGEYRVVDLRDKILFSSRAGRRCYTQRQFLEAVARGQIRLSPGTAKKMAEACLSATWSGDLRLDLLYVLRISLSTP